MKTIAKHLKGGSVIEGKEIFLVAMTGKYFLELFRV